MLSRSYLSASNKKSHREYCNKFFMLQSQLPTVTDHSTIRYDISGLRAGRLYRHCGRDPPILSKSFINSLRNMHDQKSCTIGCWKHSISQKRLQTLATYTGPRTRNNKTANNPKSIEQINNSLAKAPLAPKKIPIKQKGERGPVEAATVVGDLARSEGHIVFFAAKMLGTQPKIT